MKNTVPSGPLFMLAAAFLFTLMSMIVKLLPAPYSVWHIGFIRCFGGMCVLVSLFSRHGNPYAGYNIPLLVFRGFTGTSAFVFAVSALRILPISTATVIFYSFPVFAALFSFLIYKERLTNFQIFCMTGVFAGVSILFDFHLTGSFNGQIMALLGGLFAGLTVTLIRSLRERNGPVIIYLYFCTVGTFLTLPAFLSNPIVPASPVEWIMVAGIVLTSVSAQILMNQGFYYCRSWEGAVYMSSETVFTAAAGIFLLNDPVSWRFLAGSGLILLSGIALNYPAIKAKN